LLPTQDASQSPDDAKILKYAVELFREFGIRKPEPDSVIWVNRMDPNVVVVRLGQVKLPRKMMGKLTPEDWRPLLASAIMYNYGLTRDKSHGPLLRAVLPLGLAEIPLAYALILIFRASSQAEATILLTLTILVWIIYSSSILMFYIKWYWRILSYVADQIAAKTLGREVLLSALAKYAETISVTGYRPHSLHLWPTVNQRVDHLQKYYREKQA
jgi:Peptidase family M48